MDVHSAYNCIILYTVPRSHQNQYHTRTCTCYSERLEVRTYIHTYIHTWLQHQSHLQEVYIGSLYYSALRDSGVLMYWLMFVCLFVCSCCGGGCRGQQAVYLGHVYIYVPLLLCVCLLAHRSLRWLVSSYVCGFGRNVAPCWSNYSFVGQQVWYVSLNGCTLVYLHNIYVYT